MKHAMIAIATALTLGAPVTSFAQSMSTDSQDMMCSQTGIASQIKLSDHYDPYLAASASSTRIVQVPECDEGDITSALASLQATNIRDDIRANPDALFAIQSRGATLADVLGATTSGNVLTVYIQNVG